MALSFTGKKKIRRSFGKIPEAGAIPPVGGGKIHLR